MNLLNNKETTNPSLVEAEMKKLLEWRNLPINTVLKAGRVMLHFETEVHENEGVLQFLRHMNETFRQ